MVYMYHSFLTHLSADGHLGCFHVPAVIDSAAMNTGVPHLPSWSSFTFFICSMKVILVSTTKVVLKELLHVKSLEKSSANSWYFHDLLLFLSLLLISLVKIQIFSSVQSLSHVQLFATPWIAARQASLSITSSRSLLKLMPIESVMLSSHLILCCPLLLLPLIPPSIRVFSNESALRIRWPKHWSFSFNISPSNEHPGLISFRMDWFDLLAVQGTLKSLLQHHSSKASIFRHSGFFTVQISEKP